MKLTSQAYEVNILFRAILVGQPRGLGYPPFSVYRVALNIKSILFTELFHLIPIDAILLDEPNEVFGIVFSVMGETNEEILFFKQLFQCLKSSSLTYFSISVLGTTPISFLYSSTKNFLSERTSAVL